MAALGATRLSAVQGRRFCLPLFQRIPPHRAGGVLPSNLKAIDAGLWKSLGTMRTVNIHKSAQTNAIHIFSKTVCYGAPSAHQSYNCITQRTIPQQECWKVQSQGRTVQQSPFYRGNWGTKKPTATRSTVRGLLNVFGDPHWTDLPTITPKNLW